jgi:hypothetical protein
MVNRWATPRCGIDRNRPPCRPPFPGLPRRARQALSSAPGPMRARSRSRQASRAWRDAVAALGVAEMVGPPFAPGARPVSPRARGISVGCAYASRWVGLLGGMLVERVQFDRAREPDLRALSRRPPERAPLHERLSWRSELREGVRAALERGGAAGYLLRRSLPGGRPGVTLKAWRFAVGLLAVDLAADQAASGAGRARHRADRPGISARPRARRRRSGLIPACADSIVGICLGLCRAGRGVRPRCGCWCARSLVCSRRITRPGAGRSPPPPPRASRTAHAPHARPVSRAR